MVTAFDDEPEETITAGRSLKEKASFHRVSRNGSQTAHEIFDCLYREDG
jgi:hypothetical protein